MQSKLVHELKSVFVFKSNCCKYHNCRQAYNYSTFVNNVKPPVFRKVVIKK